MKKIIRIISAAAVTAALAVGLCFGLAGCSSSSVDQKYLQGTDQFDRQYIAASSVSDITGVKEIKVYWYAGGTVTVEPTSESTISFAEEGADGLETDAIMHYTNNNDTLVIRSAQLNYDDTKIDYTKNLTIYIPKDMGVEYLEINATKSTVNVDSAFQEAVDYAKSKDK